MHEFSYSVYISNGREYFESPLLPCGKQDFPLLDSLLELLYLDSTKIEPAFHQLGRILEQLYSSRNERYAKEILEVLKQVSDEHIYFKILLTEWEQRLTDAKRNQYADAIETLPKRLLTHIPSNIDTIQRQIKTLFGKVLNADGEEKTISVMKKMSDYYKTDGEDTLHTFQFLTLETHFELAGDTFAEVLYPKTLYEIIEFFIRQAIIRDTKVRICKNCERYFVLSGHARSEYCDRPADDKGRTCRDVGAINVWTKNKADDEVFKAYRREYKRRFAWIRTNKIRPEDFYAWSELARARKAQCDNGEISLKEFQAWLRQT